MSRATTAIGSNDATNCHLKLYCQPNGALGKNNQVLQTASD
jgi:hypothetical protein